jgi:hypothetical protein
MVRNILYFADDNDSVLLTVDDLSPREIKKSPSFAIEFTAFFFFSFPFLLSHSFLISARATATNIEVMPTHDA